MHTATPATDNASTDVPASKCPGATSLRRPGTNSHPVPYAPPASPYAPAARLSALPSKTYAPPSKTSTRKNIKTSIRHHVTLFLILLTCAVLPSAAQTPDPVGSVAPPALGALVDAFRAGDSDALMKHSAQRLDVTLFGISELFSRSQAGYVLSDFFDEYRPLRLEITETSGSEGNWFAAGRYWYERGEAPLAVYFRLRSGEGVWKLREVRIGRTADR